MHFHFISIFSVDIWTLLVFSRHCDYIALLIAAAANKMLDAFMRTDKLTCNGKQWTFFMALVLLFSHKFESIYIYISLRSAHQSGRVWQRGKWRWKCPLKCRVTSFLSSLIASFHCATWPSFVSPATMIVPTASFHGMLFLISPIILHWMPSHWSTRLGFDWV